MTATLLIGAAGLWILAAVVALGAWRRAGLVAASAVSGSVVWPPWQGESVCCCALSRCMPLSAASRWLAR